jgi:hypothetical protein
MRAASAAYDRMPRRVQSYPISLPADLFSVSVMRVGGRRESILIWDEEEDDFNIDEECYRVPRERWNERLMLGSGWLHKQGNCSARGR